MGVPASDKNADHDWPIYGGNPENNHFSPLKQINRKNVKKLHVAWTFDTQATCAGNQPIEVNGVLYGITPTQKIFGVDAASGKLLWKFDSGVKGTQPDRGLTYWSDGKESRILVGVMNFLYALDASTGKPIPTLGTEGRVDLREDSSVRRASYNQSTTPPSSIKKLDDAGAASQKRSLPLRVIFARTRFAPEAALVFHTIPQPGEFGYDTWPQDRGKIAAPRTTGPE